MNENKNICPCCGRGCDLSAPGCPRGEEYLRSGEIPAPDAGHGHKGRGHHGHGGEEQDKGHRRRGHGRDAHYGDMDREEKLLTMIGRLHHLSRAALEGKGGQKRILHILSKDGAMTQRELTERLNIRPGSASEVIKKMESAGLILRETNETDRRTATVSLSEVGRVQLEENSRKFSELNSSLFDALGDEERDSLLQLLERLGDDWEKRFREKAHGGKGCCRTEDKQRGRLR